MSIIVYKQNSTEAKNMKTKKEKIPKLSDEDYANYVMSLKDERPAKAVVPKKKK